MKRIASFEINHLTLQRGIYTSRIDGDITTYDIRMKLPNLGDYLSYPAIHTIEHIVATYVRNSEFRNEIIYFGPMGCRTGFYLLVRNIAPPDVIRLVREAFEFLNTFEGEIPGTTAIECGNYREHNLEEAKKAAAEYLPYIKNYTVEQLNYTK